MEIISAVFSGPMISEELASEPRPQLSGLKSKSGYQDARSTSIPDAVDFSSAPFLRPTNTGGVCLLLYLEFAKKVII